MREAVINSLYLAIGNEVNSDFGCWRLHFAGGDDFAEIFDILRLAVA